MRLRRRPQPASLREALLGALRRTTVLAVCVVAGLGISSLLVNTGVVGSVEEHPAPVTAARPDPAVLRTQELMVRYGCSSHNLGEVIPAHAIVRRTRTGSVRLVSFDRGWAVYEGRVPGVELVAVCRR